MTIASEDSKSGPINGNSSTVIFDYDFKILDQAHLKVIQTDANSVETTKTLTTNYSVAGVGEDSGGQITMVVAPPTGETITIVRDIAVTQPVDLRNRGGVSPEVLETALDLLTMINQQQKEELSRSVKIAASDTTTDIDTLISNVNALAAIQAAIQTVATGISNITVVADDLSEALSEIDTVANAIANVNAVGDDIANVNTVVTNIASVNTVSGAIANVNTTAGIATNITSVAGIAANVNVVAGISGNVTIVAGINTAVSAVSAISAAVTTAAANGANITIVAGISANVTTVAGISTAVSTVAGNNANVTIVSTNVANVNTVAGAIANVNTVAGISANVTTAAGIAANITTVAGISADVTTAATNMAAIIAAPTEASNAAGSASDAANSAASAATALDSFDDRYLGAKASEPSVNNDGDALITGNLYFLTGTGMQVYDGANWIAASSSGNVSLYAYEYIATAGQTTFSGADTNGQTLSYAAGNLHVTYGGLDIPTADYTATNGTTVVLDDGALVDTIVRIVAFQSFVVADTYTQAQADSRYKSISASEGGPSLGTNSVIRTNAKVIAENITFAGTENGMSIGPITVDSGYTVTVASGSTWVIL